jgi:charged multivesicular body protein 2A
MAKDLVRTRNYITKFIEMKSHLQGAALKLEVSYHPTHVPAVSTGTYTALPPSDRAVS